MLPVKIHNFIIKLSEATMDNKISWYAKSDRSKMIVSFGETTVKIRYLIGNYDKIGYFVLDILDKNNNRGSFNIDENYHQEDFELMTILYNHIQAIDLDL